MENLELRNLKKQLEALGREYVAELTKQLISADKVATGQLISSLDYEVLDTVNFSGGGTYLAGLNHTSNDSLFINCTNITNTAVNGQLYMQGNATATVVSATNTFYKVLGTTTASADNYCKR